MDQMFYKSFIVVLAVIGIRGQPIDEQSLWVGVNNLTVAVNPHRNPVIIVVNGANSASNVQSSTVPRRDDYQYTPGIGYHKFHTRALDWNSARKSCQDEGGHLAIVNSLAEAEALRKMFASSGKITGTDLTDWALLGIHDVFAEGEWLTIFGDSLSSTGFNGWANGEPNSGRHENCGTINREGRLNDGVCDRPYPYFCELSTNPSLH